MRNKDRTPESAETHGLGCSQFVIKTEELLSGTSREQDMVGQNQVRLDAYLPLKCTAQNLTIDQKKS